MKNNLEAVKFEELEELEMCEVNGGGIKEAIYNFFTSALFTAEPSGIVGPATGGAEALMRGTKLLADRKKQIDSVTSQIPGWDNSLTGLK